MRRCVLSLLLVWLVVGSGAGEAHAQSLQLFPSEAAAQAHCPADTVVWANLPTRIYHFKGMRWYGNTKSGAYVCEKEAGRNGYRATRNGQ